MELKVLCNCGQKYKFDVEPVHGRMPFPVNCPACGVDGTQLANGLLAQTPPAAAFAPAPVPIAAMTAPAPVAAMAAMSPSAAPSGLRLNRTAEPPPPIAPPIPAAVAAATATVAPRQNALPKYMQTDRTRQTNSFLLGIVGAIIGAMVAVAFMVGMDMFLGFSVGYFAIVMGAMIGFGTRLLYRGTDTTLGAMSAAVAFVTIGATLFLTVGLLGIAFSVLYLLLGTATAFKVAS